MIKKTLAIVLAIALVAAMWIIPTSAETFEDSKFFGVDFSTGSYTDTVSGMEGSITEGKSITYETDETLNHVVGVFDGETAIEYPFTNADYGKMINNFTMEAYVKLSVKSPAWGWAGICGTFWLNNNSGIALGTGNWNNALGTGDAFSITQGTTSSSPSSMGCGSKDEWSHLVYTHDGDTEALYLNGQLVASAAATQAQIPHDTTKGFRIGGYNLAKQFCVGMKYAFVNVYGAAATADEVAALYSAAAPVTPEPTEEATPEPTEEATPEPTIPVSQGDDYKVTASEVLPFKTGDTVTIRFTVSEIAEGKAVSGLDWILEYNPQVLAPVVDDEGSISTTWTSSCGDLNTETPKANWELLGYIVEDGVLSITVVEAQATESVAEAGKIWVEAQFTALADGNTGDVIAFTSTTAGTDADTEMMEGEGCIITVAEAPVEPTDEPTEEPSDEPTTPPAEEPGDVDVPVTFDIGLISLAAVALSSFTAVKRRKN